MPFSTKHVLPSSSEKQALPVLDSMILIGIFFSKGGPLPASPWAHMAVASSGAVSSLCLSVPLGKTNGPAPDGVWRVRVTGSFPVVLQHCSVVVGS